MLIKYILFASRYRSQRTSPHRRCRRFLLFEQSLDILMRAPKGCKIWISMEHTILSGLRRRRRILLCLASLLRRLFSRNQGEDDDEEEVAGGFVAEDVSKRVIATISGSGGFFGIRKRVEDEDAN